MNGCGWNTSSDIKLSKITIEAPENNIKCVSISLMYMHMIIIIYNTNYMLIYNMYHLYHVLTLYVIIRRLHNIMNNNINILLQLGGLLDQDSVKLEL